MTTPTIIVTGTDTNVGKTVFSAALAGALGASYWKPIQAGIFDGSDSALVTKLGGLKDSRILTEAYRLSTPCSPHHAAALQGIEIDRARLELPSVQGALVVEGAGGVLVPIHGEFLFADLFSLWAKPVVIVARTELGTINHSLLSIEALRRRGVPVLGIAFNGHPNDHSEEAIVRLGRVRRLGRLPWIEPLDQASLTDAFAPNFDAGDFS